MTQHMVQLTINERILKEWLHGIGLLHVDIGYGVHSLLRAAFGEAAPQPFAIRFAPPGQGQAPTIGVLGYTAMEADILKRIAGEVAEPKVFAAISPETMVSKPLPDGWDAGRSYSFELRACPVCRSDHGERDAFLSAVHKVDKSKPLDRESVYADWLSRQLDRAAKLDKVELASFSLDRLDRRSAPNEQDGRKCVGSIKPNALFRGQLTVRDSNAFSEVLSRGVGRHRAFGFGMLLIRPAGSHLLNHGKPR